MKTPIREIVIVLVAVGAIALACILTKRRTPVREEVGTEGLVTSDTDRISPFAAEYRTAGNLLSCGKISEAESIYRELTKKEPDSELPYIGLGTCQMRRDNDEEARKLYQQALDMNPESVSALTSLGSVYFQLSDYRNAIEKYKAALALDEEYPDAHWGLVSAYAGLGEMTLARIHLDRFKQLAPGSHYISHLESLVEDSTPRTSTPAGADKDTGLDR